MFLNHIESGAPTLEHREATPHPQYLPVCVPLSVPRGWGKIRRGRLEDSQFAPGETPGYKEDPESPDPRALCSADKCP